MPKASCISKCGKKENNMNKGCFLATTFVGGSGSLEKAYRFSLLCLSFLKRITTCLVGRRNGGMDGGGGRMERMGGWVLAW